MFLTSPSKFCPGFQVADLSMGDLLLHTTVIWPNPPASLGKWKKEPELAAFGMCHEKVWRGRGRLAYFSQLS